MISYHRKDSYFSRSTNISEFYEEWYRHLTLWNLSTVALTIWSISSRVMVPLLSKSYSRKAPKSFFTQWKDQEWRTFELVLKSAAGSDRKSLKKLFEFDRSVAVFVEDIEDEPKKKSQFRALILLKDLRSKSARVAMRKELVVNLGEFILCQFSGRAILQKTIVPVADLFRSD